MNCPVGLQIIILREKLHLLPEQIYAELNKDLEKEIELGNVRNLSLLDIFISMLALNIALFMMMPVVENVLQLNEVQKEFMLEHRKSENVEFILKSLRP